MDPHEAAKMSNEQENISHNGEFAHGKVDPHEAGKLSHKSHEFAHGKVDPSEAAKMSHNVSE